MRGFDLSIYQGDVSQAAYNCLKSNGFEFGVVQAQTAGGNYNPYGSSSSCAVTTLVAHDIQRAHAAGIKNVDVYIFPDTKKGATEQTRATIQHLLNDGVLKSNMVWLEEMSFIRNRARMDIEGTQYWTSNCNTNANFLREMINTVDSMYKGLELTLNCVTSQLRPQYLRRNLCVKVTMDPHHVRQQKLR